MRFRTHATALLTVSLAALGCSTLDTRTSGYNGPPVYSGTRQATGLFVAGFQNVNPFLMAFELLDIAASGAADTLLLPLTIAEQSAYNTRRTEAARTDIEQPSVVSVSRGDPPLRSARRLFRQCQSLISNFGRAYADCYSIGAKIEITTDAGTREITGGEYKTIVRDYFDTHRETGRFIRYVKAGYEPEGDSTVRIRADRIDSELEGSVPVEFVVAPGEDDQWRIISEKSPGFAD